jgi:hypothetical protein
MKLRYEAKKRQRLHFIVVGLILIPRSATLSLWKCLRAPFDSLNARTRSRFALKKSLASLRALEEVIGSIAKAEFFLSII